LFKYPKIENIFPILTSLAKKNKVSYMTNQSGNFARWSDDFEDLNKLATLAINAALSNDWATAIKVNKELLGKNSQDIEAVNRLGRAYLELGKLELAKQTYQKVLQIDPYNLIALKNLKRLAKVRTNGKVTNGLPNNCEENGKNHNNQAFLAEPGKTKLANLVKLTTPTQLSLLCSGDEVFLLPKNHSIAVYDTNNQYLGALPDDLSHHLIPLIRGGNKYQVFVKRIAANALQVFIRETSRSKKFVNLPSFFENNHIRNRSFSVRQESIKPDLPVFEEFSEE